MRANLLFVLLGIMFVGDRASGEETRRYENRLRPIENPSPLLADHPAFVEPIREQTRFEAPPLVMDAEGSLEVRAWRFSYNARGIIEMPNRLDPKATAVIVVHPWGIDDDWGWKSPEPAGVAFQCTPAKNAILHQHIAEVVNPFLQRLRPCVNSVLYSLPGVEDPIRKKVYRSFRSRTSASHRSEGEKELHSTLSSFAYEGEPLPGSLVVSQDLPVRDYFKQFQGLDAGPTFNGKGFWDLPIPVCKAIDVDLDDVVIYDGEGYDALREFLKKEGVRHVLLTGYNTDMCFCLTTAGYKNLSKDFNVFLVGDATVATFPSNPDPRFATNAAISYAALNQLVTQCSWIKINDDNDRARDQP